MLLRVNQSSQTFLNVEMKKKTHVNLYVCFKYLAITGLPQAFKALQTCDYAIIHLSRLCLQRLYVLGCNLSINTKFTSEGVPRICLIYGWMSYIGHSVS